MSGPAAFALPYLDLGAHIWQKTLVSHFIDKDNIHIIDNIRKNKLDFIDYFFPMLFFKVDGVKEEITL